MATKAKSTARILPTLVQVAASKVRAKVAASNVGTFSPNVMLSQDVLAGMFRAVAAEKRGASTFALVAALSMLIRSEHVGEAGDKLESPAIASMGDLVAKHCADNGLSEEYARFLKSCAVSFVRLHRASLSDTVEATIASLAQKAGVNPQDVGTGTIQALREGKTAKAFNAARRERTAKAADTRAATEKAARGSGPAIKESDAPAVKAEKAMAYALRLAESGTPAMLQAAVRDLSNILAKKLAAEKATTRAKAKAAKAKAAPARKAA